jgi:hypothetical protein
MCEQLHYCWTKLILKREINLLATPLGCYKYIMFFWLKSWALRACIPVDGLYCYSMVFQSYLVIYILLFLYVLISFHVVFFRGSGTYEDNQISCMFLEDFMYTVFYVLLLTSFNCCILYEGWYGTGWWGIGVGCIWGRSGWFTVLTSVVDMR